MPNKRSESDVAFGALLKELRDAARLSSEDLARSLPSTRRTVDRYMRGERRPDRRIVEHWETLCGAEPGSLVREYESLPKARRSRGEHNDGDDAEPSPASGDSLEPTDATYLAERMAPEDAPEDFAPNGGAADEPPPPTGRRARALGVVVIVAAVALIGVAGYGAGYFLSDHGRSARRDSHAEQLYSEGLSAIRSRLDRARVKERHALGDAEDPNGQSAAARRVSDAFATAGRSTQLLTVPARATAVARRLLGYLVRATSAYAALAKAAAGGHGHDYNTAVSRIKRAENDVQAALAAHRSLG